MCDNNISAFVEQLLTAQPGPPYSVQLEIDSDKEDACTLFEVLLTIMTEILKKWYAPPISIGLITQEDKKRLADYFASFGILIQFEASTDNHVTISNRDYLTKSRLDDMKFKMRDQNKIYSVAFSNLAIR